MTTKLKSFQVWAECHRQVALEIKAENLEDAIVKSKELEEDDFVTVNGDYMDESTRVTGVIES